MAGRVALERVGSGVVGLIIDCLPDGDISAAALAWRGFRQHDAMYVRRLVGKWHWCGIQKVLGWLAPVDAWALFRNEAIGSRERARLVEEAAAVPPTSSVVVAAQRVSLHDAFVKYKTLVLQGLEAGHRWFAQCVVLADIDISPKGDMVTCIFRLTTCTAPMPEVTCTTLSDMVDVSVATGSACPDENTPATVFASADEPDTHEEGYAALAQHVLCGARSAPSPQDMFRIILRLVLFPKPCVSGVVLEPAGLRDLAPSRAHHEEVAAYLAGATFKRTRRVM
eukprot:TRINITY_DN13282_c0_g1_i1.p1 TRINITY_DN13282_c0_g1~~TRINITY_DN13282_c0_g1_i1.p1  ORF type:complete len:281 (+),score=27.34 TRINITY_DN13282_c0_g1_i1:135-977(+)